MAIVYASDWSSEHNQYMTHETQYQGCVLCTRERNYYDDSDFYALVWDEDEQRIKDIEYATTRFACGNSAHTDALDEIKEKVQQYIIDYLFPQYIIFDKAQANMPIVFKDVIVVKGRKVKIGTQGRVVWRGTDNYYRGRGTKWNVGIETKDGNKYFTAADNCDVICSWEYETGAPIIREMLENESYDELLWRYISRNSGRAGMVVM